MPFIREWEGGPIFASRGVSETLMSEWHITCSSPSLCLQEHGICVKVDLTLRWGVLIERFWGMCSRPVFEGTVVFAVCYCW